MRLYYDRKSAAPPAPAAVADARERLSKAIGALEAPLLRHPTLLREGFSVADVIVSANLLWAKFLVGLDAFPQVVKEYAVRMAARPARLRAVAD